MNLSELGNRFTEMSSGETIGEIREELSVIDLGIGNLSVSLTPCDSSFGETDGSSASMVKADVSDADRLLLAFNSISIAKSVEPMGDDTAGSVTADVLDSNGCTDLSGQKHVKGDSSKPDSVDLPTVAEPFAQGGGDGEVFAGIDKTGKTNRPLILYTSARRKTRNVKLDQSGESREKPSKCGRMTGEKAVVNLSSLQILRKNRSSLSKRPRSSVWGCLGNTAPGSKESVVLSPNLGNGKKEKRVRGGKGKKNPPKGQMSQESLGKMCPPTGRISLKIKIGNKICSMGNAASENCSSSGQDFTESIGTVENVYEEKHQEVMISPHERNSEKVSSDACALSNPPDGKVTFDNSYFSTSSDFHHIKSPDEGDSLVASIENLCSDVGTSPDSEVINTVPDVPLCEKGLPDIPNGPVISNACVSPGDTSSLILSPKKSKKGNKKDKLHLESNCTSDINPACAESSNNVKIPVCTGDVSSMTLPQTEFKKGKKKVKPHELADSSVQSKDIGTETTNETEVEQKLSRTMVTSSKQYLHDAETDPCPELAATGPNTEVHVTVPCSSGRKPSKCSGAKGGIKCRSKISDISSKKDKSLKKKGNKNKLGGGHQESEKVGAVGSVLNGVKSLRATGHRTPTDLGEIGALGKDSTGSSNSLQFLSDGVMEQHIPLRDAWVLCDECEKWRRIPAVLADQIEETNRRWTCKENADRNFADCSIPQEKSDSAINQELGISDASCEEEADGTSLKSSDNQPNAAQSWSLIKSNLFLHRSRKSQTIDEVMVCHCKPPSNGRMGCGTKCLNRMLNIECVQGTCPCGELCSNQQFQKRKYAKLKWFKCGKKGYGLQALEEISKGRFLIEYVGEVLDVHVYEARQREYALNGHKHFYFMTLNGSEVIDACAKGNLGRFINHSCDPNCRTEKWMVNGEVCIGLFAVRDIKKGEEVTFDYNYVRVFGAAAKKCVCGSPNCRGYIGGDPTNSEVIVQDDSDDEYSEPLMTCEDREMNEEWNEIISSSLNDKENEVMHGPVENRYNTDKFLGILGENIPDSQASDSVTQKVEGVSPGQVAGSVVEVEKSFNNGLVEPLEIDKQTDDSLNSSVLVDLKAKSEDLHSRALSPEPIDVSLETDGSPNKEMCSAHESVVTAASPSKSFSDTVESKRKLKCASVGGRDELSKSNSRANTKRSSSSVRKGKPKASVVNDKGSPDMDNLNATLPKSKKLPGLPITNHFEAVEEKLNELLDPEGGISKRKDASRGYLKLLFLTAASGNNGHGEAIQSNRDLSMILDALLKTKSRSVLVDVINKNGLQMLHNIMKRYRKEFIKTPILRKLLKVLEHLATRQILTLEHITGGPPCPGVESFKDSILILTEHADKQVHQIARSFRDRWIPRSLRKSCCVERDSGRNEINQHTSHDGFFTSNNHWSDRDGRTSEAMNSCEKQSTAASSTVESSTQDPSASGANGIKTRKRKSRWDNPVAETPYLRTTPNLGCDKQLSSDEDLPPGFSSPCEGHAIPSDTSSTAVKHDEIGMQKQQRPRDVVLGIPQIRFHAHVPVSYGISKSLVQQFGVPKAELSNCWTIAPGAPYLPFPPLPPHPCGSGDLPISAAGCASVSELTEKPEQHADSFAPCQVGQKRPRTCIMDPPDNSLSVPNGQPDIQQGTCNGLGRKYFRQQKWNHSKLAPPWVRMRNGWGYAGNNPQNNSPGVAFGNGTNGFRNLYNGQETNWRG